MSIFDEIRTGLNEAIEYEKGKLKAKAVNVSPIEEYTASEIKGRESEPSQSNLTCRKTKK